ncbi:Reverse transcriptase from transposon X-element protein [Ceratobasidium sp. AG-Ba]|nr:Reverse transcriptase from transposon X-element protein [Ceratobasidium sp. AG-Ba]
MQDTFRIWQLNVNKSEVAQLALTGDPRVRSSSILAIQEPFLDPLDHSRFPLGWTSVYPSTHGRKNSPRSRAFIAINPSLSTNGWEQLACNCADIAAIRVLTDRGQITVINVYNPCDSNASLPYVRGILQTLPADAQVVLLGDFNRHHPLWDEDRNAHLFTAANLELAQELIDLAGAHDLEMALPKDIPTLQATRTKNFTRPDNVFLSSSLSMGLVSCNTLPDCSPPNTDHLPIVTEIAAEPLKSPEVERWNFKDMREEEFRRILRLGLDRLAGKPYAEGQAGLDERADDLTRVITEAVGGSTPKFVVTPHLRRWWSKDLTAFRREVRKLAGCAFKARFRPSEPIHETYKVTRNRYAQAIRDAKRKHWEEFLETLDEETLWTAARYINGEHSDGGRARIPNLQYTRPLGETAVARDNQTKSQVLLEAFFPPAASGLDEGVRDTTRVQDLPSLTVENVLEAIRGMRPHKAPGPDGLPALVYIVGADLLAPHLLAIYADSLDSGIYPRAWQHSRTVVLRKPGKPDYSLAKAYRPIALLNVMGKILSACIAKRLNTLADTHGWIPAHHFGGKPGHTTTDALHLMVKKVKDAWNRREVVSALFLDVKGAFPHANPTRLAQNMRNLGVPEVYVSWTLAKLNGRTTCLAFDDYISDSLPISNGIDQGCPLSVIYYLFYNSPLVRIARPAARELCLGYIDDITLLVWGRSAEENNARLLDMMTRKRGALNWSHTHNSTFELDKTALIHFSPNKKLARPPLVIGPQTIQAVKSHTLLGVILDQELRFKEQCNKALIKGLQWTSQLGRLARMSYGASPRTARRLYLSIAVPRFTYAADVWFQPVRPPTTGSTRFRGSIGFARRLAVVQSSAARAILGALRSTPVVHLDAFASLLPLPYLMNEACQRAAVRLITAPETHPLRKSVDHALRGRKSHLSPLHHILAYVKDIPYNLERWEFKGGRVTPLTVPPGLFPSRDTALLEAERDHARIKIYVDGARNKHGVSGAAVLRVHDLTKLRVGARLGDREHYSILEGELAGILCAVKILDRLLYIGEATIYSDSQLAISCVEGFAHGAPRDLIKAINDGLEKIKSRRDGKETRLRWCPAHRGNVGNALADHEARVAAKGEQYPHEFVHEYLRHYKRQISASVAKGLLKEANREFAIKGWASTDAARKILDKYPSVQPETFLNNTADLPRSHSTLLFRLITGHIQLQRHLHKIQVVDSPICKGCEEAEESVAHFMLRCRRYAHIRQEVLASRGRDFLNLSFLFSNKDAFPIVIDYIRRTHRFSDLLR